MLWMSLVVLILCLLAIKEVDSLGLYFSSWHFGTLKRKRNEKFKHRACCWIDEDEHTVVDCIFEFHAETPKTAVPQTYGCCKECSRYKNWLRMMDEDDMASDEEDLRLLREGYTPHHSVRDKKR
jgi:hypothetical protein